MERPQWTGVYESWAKSWVHKNFWRVSHVFGSREDAVQQCALIFAKCLNSYADKVDNPAWFMALFKRSVFHHWATSSLRDHRQRPLGLSSDTPITTGRRRNGEILGLFAAPEAAGMVDLLGSTSQELRTALKMLQGSGDKVLAMLTDERSSVETLNKRWQRMARVKADHNLVVELRDLLGVPNAKGHLRYTGRAERHPAHKRRGRKVLQRHPGLGGGGGQLDPESGGSGDR